VLMKLSVTNEMYPKFQDNNDEFAMWRNLLKMHEITNKGRSFFLKNMLFSIQIEPFNSLLDYLLKNKDIRDQLRTIVRTMGEEDMLVVNLKKLSSSYANFVETLNIIGTCKNMTFE